VPCLGRAVAAGFRAGRRSAGQMDIYSRSKAARGHRRPVSAAPLAGDLSAPKQHTSQSITTPSSFPDPSPAETAGEAAGFWPAAPPLGPGDCIAKPQELPGLSVQTRGISVNLKLFPRACSRFASYPFMCFSSNL
jgi:hypothetical protein